jgi:hypothetical protein
MTLQDLKDNRAEIIETIKNLGCEDVLKTFMELILMEVEFGTKENIQSIITQVYEDNFKFSRKKNPRWMDKRESAELKGTWDEHKEMKNYYSNKFSN